MRFATYTLRVECEEMQADEDLDWVNENLPRLLSEAERLVSDQLPEGWYAKVDEDRRDG